MDVEEALKARAMYEHVAELAHNRLPALIDALNGESDVIRRRQTEARASVLRQVQTCYSDIQYGKEKNHVALKAWAARNLLELWVWSLYITRSDTNLERFNRDVMLDVIETVTALSLPTNDDGHRTPEQHERFVSEMQKHKIAMGYAPKERILHVGGIAKEVGLEKVYSKYYPMFSKAAHQSAMLVLAGPQKHPMGAGMPEIFSSIVIWQIITTVVAGYPAAETLLPPLPPSFFTFPSL